MTSSKIVYARCPGNSGVFLQNRPGSSFGLLVATSNDIESVERYREFCGVSVAGGRALAAQLGRGQEKLLPWRSQVTSILSSQSLVEEGHDVNELVSAAIATSLGSVHNTVQQPQVRRARLTGSASYSSPALARSTSSVGDSCATPLRAGGAGS